MFGLFRRKKPGPPPDPLAAFDAALEELDREGATLHRSAATLLMLRTELGRTLSRQRTQKGELERRIAEALGRQDDRAAGTFGRDLAHLSTQIAANEASLAKAEADGETLTQSALLLQDRQSALKAERASAQAQIALGQVIETALIAPQRAERMVALEAARDEIERAHALAEIYREDAKSQG